MRFYGVYCGKYNVRVCDLPNDISAWRVGLPVRAVPRACDPPELRSRHGWVALVRSVWAGGYARNAIHRHVQ